MQSITVYHIATYTSFAARQDFAAVTQCNTLLRTAAHPICYGTEFGCCNTHNSLLQHNTTHYNTPHTLRNTTLSLRLQRSVVVEIIFYLMTTIHSIFLCCSVLHVCECVAACCTCALVLQRVACVKVCMFVRVMEQVCVGVCL